MKFPFGSEFPYDILCPENNPPIIENVFLNTSFNMPVLETIYNIQNFTLQSGTYFFYCKYLFSTTSSGTPIYSLRLINSVSNLVLTSSYGQVQNANLRTLQLDISYPIFIENETFFSLQAASNLSNTEILSSVTRPAGIFSRASGYSIIKF